MVVGGWFIVRMNQSTVSRLNTYHVELRVHIAPSCNYPPVSENCGRQDTHHLAFGRGTAEREGRICCLVCARRSISHCVMYFTFYTTSNKVSFTWNHLWIWALLSFLLSLCKKIHRPDHQSIIHVEQKGLLLRFIASSPSFSEPAGPSLKSLPSEGKLLMIFEWKLQELDEEKKGFRTIKLGTFFCDQ